MRAVQHRVGLAGACGGAEVNRELAVSDAKAIARSLGVRRARRICAQIRLPRPGDEEVVRKGRVRELRGDSAVRKRYERGAKRVTRRLGRIDRFVQHLAAELAR